MVACAVAGASGQESLETVTLEPCIGPCGLTLVLEREFGDDDGPGMIEATYVQGWTDDVGRIYIAGEQVAHIQVFRPDGEFLRRIGRRGEGPGELQHASSLAMRPDGAFSVLDRQRGVILTFDADGTLRGEVRSRGWLPVGMETLHVEGSLAVHHADIRTPDLVGYPLHMVDLDTGELKESFGSMSGEYPVGSSLDHVIARGPGRAVWMAERYEYYIELWDTDQLLRSLRRDAEWFPVTTLSEIGHGWEEEPSPFTPAIAADDSLLWVLVLTADEQWEEGGKTRNDEQFFDTIIEVIDWKGGRVVASQRLDEDFFHWVQPGLLGRLVTTPAGSVSYRTYRVILDGQ